MREIKFRGKRIDNGEWIYSYSINYNFINVTNKIIKTSVYLGDGANGIRLIDSKTVGQYTSLKDKNGKEIYEGDIVNYWQDDPEQAPYNRDYIAFEDGGFVKKDRGSKVGDGTGGSMWQNKDFVENECEVIGNIYENPNLLT